VDIYVDINRDVGRETHVQNYRYVEMYGCVDK
jgi:hypothetical protein